MIDYQKQVRAAAAALKRGEDSNWDLARLTFEVCGPPGRGGHVAKPITLAQWAKDVAVESGRRFSATTASYYRDIWTRFESQYHQGDIDFTNAYAQIRGGSVGERMVEHDFKRAMTNASAEQKREAFATLAREPEVLADLPTSTEVFSQIVRDNPAAVQEAWKDTQTNVGLSKARWEARDELLEPQREAARENREVFEPKDATLDRRIFLADVATKVEQWTRELNGIREFLEFSDDVDRIRRWATRQALDRLVDAATSCRDALPSSYEEQAEAPAPASRARRRLA